jgi:hypothetical protein
VSTARLGKSCGRQRTQYSVDTVPSVAAATMAWFSFTVRSTTWEGLDGDVVGPVRELTAPGDAVIDTSRSFVPAAQRT